MGRQQAVFKPSSRTTTAPSTTSWGMLSTTCAFQSLYYQADRRCIRGAARSRADDDGRVFAMSLSRMTSASCKLPCEPQHHVYHCSTKYLRAKALFKDDWEGLIGNADTLLYLGGNEVSTFKYISELLGKETLDTRTRSVSKRGAMAPPV